MAGISLCSVGLWTTIFGTHQQSNTGEDSIIPSVSWIHPTAAVNLVDYL